MCLRRWRGFISGSVEIQLEKTRKAHGRNRVFGVANGEREKGVGFRNALGTFMHCERLKRRPEENDLGRDPDPLLRSLFLFLSISFFHRLRPRTPLVRVATPSNAVIGPG